MNYTGDMLFWTEGVYIIGFVFEEVSNSVVYFFFFLRTSVLLIKSTMKARPKL